MAQFEELDGPFNPNWVAFPTPSLLLQRIDVQTAEPSSLQPGNRAGEQFGPETGRAPLTPTTGHRLRYQPSFPPDGPIGANNPRPIDQQTNPSNTRRDDIEHPTQDLPSLP